MRANLILADQCSPTSDRLMDGLETVGLDVDGSVPCQAPLSRSSSHVAVTVTVTVAVAVNK